MGGITVKLKDLKSILCTQLGMTQWVIVWNSETAEELEGNREVMKQVMLENIREIFVKKSDQEKIVDISITNYMISQ